MTYNVFSGTLNPTQSVNHRWKSGWNSGDAEADPDGLIGDEEWVHG